jgi:ribose 5-phosphate isomerase B
VRVAVVADHNGVHLKAALLDRLVVLGHLPLDRGVAEDATVVDYPALCEDACRQVLAGSCERAVVVGGSGMGETIACNKLRGIRAGLCHDQFTAHVSRANNDANVMVLGAKVITTELALTVLEQWLTTPFSGGVHARRLAQVRALERGQSLL